MTSLIVPNDEFFKYAIELLSLNKNVLIKAKGRSMTPIIINERDDVLIAPLSNNYIPQIHDIILFKEPSTKRYILHRIIGKNKDTFIIRGDGNPYLKEYCKLEDIIGYVIEVNRNVKNKTTTIKKDSLKWHIWRYLGIIRRMLQRIYIKTKKIFRIS